MNIIEVDDYHKLLRGALPIGVGTTAYCFLMPDKNVFKLFKKIYRESTLFQTNNMLQRLYDICVHPEPGSGCAMPQRIRNHVESGMNR